MRRIECLFLFSAAVLLTPLHAAETPRKWNVLFLMADDWRPEIACYGTAGMSTPHVDKLASSAVRFDVAYCQFPVCNPSRTSLMTGRYPTQTGNIFNGEHHFRAIHPDFITLPQYFKQHGYVTANAGKLFHGKAQDPPSWTEWIEDGVPREARLAARAAPMPPKSAEQPKEKNPDREKDKDNDDGAGAPGERFKILAGDGESDKDYWIAVNGIKLLEKYKDQPFFIGIGFHRPHAIPTAPQKYFDLYDVDKMPLPPDFASRPTLPKEIPADALPKENDPYMNREITPLMAKEVIRAYRASASWVDWNIGRVLDTLDRLGLAEKTIVVFLSDHGYHNGDGAPIGYSVRTERWHYAEWRGGAEGAVLFDPAKDPHEMTNLATDPANTATVAEMKTLLKDAFGNMPWRIPAPPRIPAAKKPAAN